jgi:beta-phosphoglucomutase-like phosphatase (HAD superfamily)
VYLQTLSRLKLPAAQCLAFEDSQNGLQSAISAGLATIITPNSFTADHNFTGALRVVPDLATTTVDHLRAWHAEALAAR